MLLTHYFKSVIKNIRKSSKVSTFNLIGLSVSFASFLLLAMYLHSEFTFDQLNEKHENIYLLNLKGTKNGEINTSCYLPNPMADVIAEHVPEVKLLNSFAWGPRNYSHIDSSEKFFELNCRAVDSTFTDIFTINIVKGNPNPLRKKDHIIISESSARMVFGEEDPIGKTILANFSTPYTVEAVFEDIPANSSFRYDGFTSFPTASWVNEWSEYSFIHFFLFNEDTDFEEVNQKIKAIPRIKEVLEEQPDNEFNFTFTNLNDIHFYPEISLANKSFTITLLLVAILILVMAFINYINFAIANVPKTVKTNNIRRIVGASKSSLYLLNIIESAFIISISFIIALVLAQLTLKLWPDIFGYTLYLADNAGLIFTAYLLFIIIGTLLTLIPAGMVANVKPALAIKGMVRFSTKKGISAKALTVIQYSISIILIISVLFIEKQISFIKNYNLGFDKENTLVVTCTRDILEHEEAFAAELMKHPGITEYAYSQFVPGGVGMGWGRDVDGKHVNFKCWPVDERYLNFMGFELVSGRNFSDNIEADENKFIFNEAAIRTFGWEDNHLGKMIPGFGFEGELIGVVKDMKYASLREEVQPMAFWLTKSRHNLISLKIDGPQTVDALRHVKEVYEKFEPKFDLDYSFLDERLDNLYRSEEKQASLILTFCIISIIISVIGALGLIIFMCEYRVKEIGIRKVNGATIGEIIRMLNWDFMKWIFLSYLIAVPVSFYFIHHWLQSFAYRINIEWYIFAAGGIITMIIALLSVSWKSWSAAKRNPVESLRYE